MFDRIGEWAAAFDPAGSVPLPGWAVAVIAAFVVVVAVLAFMRGADGRGGAAVRLAGVIVIALAGWWGLDHLARRDLAGERFDARAFDLATRAVAPGSPLACLDAIAGELVEDACERSLFASPESTAAAVSYVAAQLALLASAGDHRRREGFGSRLVSLRRAIEADRFGIVAHVLTVREGCTPDRCAIFALLQDAGRISTNLAEHPFEARVKRHMAAWTTASARPVAANAPGVTAPPAPAATSKPPSNVYFPSSASIPPVNIMTAEPPAQPHDTTGAVEPVTPTPPRRPPGTRETRQPGGPGAAPPARATPMQLAPGAQ